jgi:hypothetical protein
VPLQEARRQLSFFPYMHVSFGAADHLNHLLDMYEDWHRENPGNRLLIRDWVRKHYFVVPNGESVQPWYDGVLYVP